MTLPVHPERPRAAAKPRGVLFLAVAALLSAGCGLEGLTNLYLAPDYTQPVSTIRGAISLDAPEFTVFDAAGNEIPVFDSRVEGGQYAVELISGDYSGLRLRATQGQAITEAFVPRLPAEGAVDVDLDVTSTATVKLVEGLLGPSGKELTNLSDELVCIMGKKVDHRVSQGGPTADLLTMMERIFGAANRTVTTTTWVFQTPRVDPAYTIIDSALNPDWIVRSRFDYDANGVQNTTTEVFDAAFVSALQTLELSAPPDPDRVRVVFAVDFNEGKLNGLCGNINRFKWVRDEPGKQMYFVGGIHKESPVQSTEIDAMLGNRGGWTPNQIKMYDDGTNGDAVAGDGIWSLYFDLPRGLRMGYKYTWGKQGQLWTGTEEWPGNQRILEVVDVNDDGYVYRFDNFGDEASNKDLSNLNPAAGGSLEWDEDLNGDGVPEAREGPAQVDTVCGLDPLGTPDWVPALTVGCEDFVAGAE